MRLVYLTNCYPKTSHTFIRREIVELEKRGHEVHRLTIRPPQSDLVDPLDIAEVDRTTCILGAGAIRLLLGMLIIALSRPLRTVSALVVAMKMGQASDRGLIRHLIYAGEACWLYRYAASHRIEHVHVHFGTNCTAVARLAWYLGGPSYSFTVHGPDEFDAAIGLSLRGKIEDAAFVVAITHYCRAQLCRWVDYKHWEKIKIVHCTVGDEYLIGGTPVDPDSHLLLCVGRLSAQKGQHLILDALKLLADEGETFELVLAGDGEMRSEIEQRISENGLEDSVTITGWVENDEIRDYLRRCRALLLPSFAEGLPVVIMEALAQGRPVLSTYVAGIPELVRYGENGWLVPAADTHSLVAAIREVMQTPADTLDRMGKDGYRRVVERHTVRTEVAELERLFMQFAQSGFRSFKRSPAVNRRVAPQARHQRQVVTSRRDLV